MRASDFERQRTIDELRRHCAAGRLDVDEYADRIEKAMSATTLEELDHLRSDLPMMRIAEPARAAHLGSGALAALDDPGASRSAGRRLSAVALAALSVAVVLAVVVLSLVAEWAWAAVLVIGWTVGLIQGRSSRHLRWRG